MRRFTMSGVLCLAAVSMAPVARAEDDRCKEVRGNFVSTTIPAPNDPFGRALGSSTGGLKAEFSGYLTSLVPQPNGSIQATSVEVFRLGPQDLLVLTCQTTATPVPGEAVGTVRATTAYTVVGGTGKYLGASGTMNATSKGFNAFGPKAGPGGTHFEGEYSGKICRAR